VPPLFVAGHITTASEKAHGIHTQTSFLPMSDLFNSVMVF